MKAFLKAMALAAVAGGCSDGGSGARVSSEDYASQYDYNQFRLAADGNAFPVSIIGNPFPALSKGEVDQRLLAVMQVHKPRPRLTFALDNTKVGHRLVLVFDAANGVGAARVCKGDVTSGPHVSGQLSVFAVYCRGEVPMSQAIGRTGATAPEDKSVAQLFDDLFPTVFSDAPNMQPNHGYPGGLL